MPSSYQFCAASLDDPAAETWLTADSLGVTSIVRRRLHAATDTLTVTLSGQQAATADSLWTYGQLIRCRRTDTDPGGATTSSLLFLGRAQPYTRSASGPSESSTIEILGIWDWFERTQMRQPWAESDASSVYAPHVILFCDGKGGRLPTGPQLTAAIQCAIDSGAPCQPGSDPDDFPTGITPPYDEQLNLSVSDAITKCLANHPHLLLWADYSTRLPTIHAKTRSSLPPATVPLTSCASATVKSREDLQPPAVAIAYIRQNTDGDRTYTSTAIDYAPVIPDETDTQRRARLYAPDTLWGCYEMDGSSAQYASQEIQSDPLDWDTDSTSPDWWKAHCPSIANATVTAITSPSRTSDLPNILTKGAIAPWMNRQSAEATFTASATILRSNTAGAAEKRVETISFTATLTDASTKTYKKMIAYDSGELPPSGLAAALLSEWSQLHHDGSITLTSQDPPPSPSLGQTLNISGGIAGWADMAALITQTTEDFTSGTLEASFGVPQWVDLDSRVAWSRACRARRYAWRRDLQPQDPADQPDGLSGPTAFPGIRKPSAEPTVWLRQRFIDPSADVRHQVDINLDDLSDEASPQTLKLRPAYVLTKNALGAIVAQHAYVLASEPSGDETPLAPLSIRYDQDSGQLQTSSDGGATWDCIPGGQTVQETT